MYYSRYHFIPFVARDMYPVPGTRLYVFLLYFGGYTVAAGAIECVFG